MKVLHVVSSLKTGGVEKLLYDLYEHVDRNDIEFSFITHNDPGMIEECLAKKNVKIYHLINRRKHPILSALEFFKFLSKNHFDIIHFHGNIEVLLEVIAAKLAGNNNLIIHSHNYKKNLSFLHKIIMHLTQKITVNFAKMCIGCSMAAGYYGFGNILHLNNYVTIYNGIELGKYKFNKDKRSLLRKNLKIENNEFVIGTIGRFTKQKNQILLLKIIAAMKNHQNLKVLIIGEGEDYYLLKKFVDDNCLNNIVSFLGIRDDVPDLLSCFDLFVLTSKYEGLPIVGIEAQASGLDCLFSDEITSEIKITENVRFLPIKDYDIEKWVKNIEVLIVNKNLKSRLQSMSENLQKNFDIERTSAKFVEVYKKVMIQVK